MGMLSGQVTQKAYIIGQFGDCHEPEAIRGLGLREHKLTFLGKLFHEVQRLVSISVWECCRAF